MSLVLPLFLFLVEMCNGNGAAAQLCENVDEFLNKMVVSIYKSHLIIYRVNHQYQVLQLIAHCDIH